jgi:hypothetical protein
MKRLIGGGLAALAVLAILTGCSATGGAPRSTVEQQDATAISSPPWLHPVVTAPPALPLKYYPGDTVQNGSLQYVVQGTRTATRVYDQFGGYVPASDGAEFFIVKVSVRNVSQQAVQFFPVAQTLSVRGQQFNADPMSTAFVDTTGIGVIQPGQSVSTELSFLVWAAIKPEAIMLSDMLGGSPAATRVELVTP